MPKQPFQVIFTYDEPSNKWEVSVTGANSDTEAKQGFNAVIFTCSDVVVSMSHKTEKTGEMTYKLAPTV